MIGSSSITNTAAKRYSPLPKKSNLHMQQQEADVKDEFDELRDELDRNNEMDTDVRDDGVADDDKYGTLIGVVKLNVKLIKENKKLLRKWEHKLSDLVDQRDVNMNDLKKYKQIKKAAIQKRNAKYKKSLKIAQKALDDATTVSEMKRAREALHHLSETRNKYFSTPSQEMKKAQTMLKRLKERQDKLTKRIKHAEKMLKRLKREIDTLHEELPLLKRMGQEILEKDVEKLNKDRERSVDGLARGVAGCYGCSFSFWG